MLASCRGECEERGLSFDGGDEKQEIVDCRKGKASTAEKATTADEGSTASGDSADGEASAFDEAATVTLPSLLTLERAVPRTGRVP